jgi:hypothetical protein
MAGSLSVRKANAAKARKRRFETQRATRSENQSRALDNLSALGSGIASIPGRVVNYIKTSTPSGVVGDVKNLASSVYDAAKEDPGQFIGDTIFSPLAAVRDFGDVRAMARKLREQGRNDEAQKLEAMAGLSVLSAIPVVGKVTGTAIRDAEQAALRGAVREGVEAETRAATKAATKAATTAATEKPIRLAGAPSDFMVSTRRPSEANFSVFGDPDTELILQSGDAMKLTPEGFAKNMAQLTEAPFMSDMVGASPDAIYDTATRRGADNLKFIAEELMPQDAAERAVEWYPTANRLGAEYASRINQPAQAGWGALAVTSPQTPWPVNVARVDRMTQMMGDNFAVDPEGVKRWLAERAAMAEKGRNPGAVFSQGEPYMQRIIETPFSDLDNDMDRYSRIVLADASRFPNRVKNITPEGEFTEDFGPMTWGSSREIGSALNIMNDPSMANIRAQLTGGGKVPSFFNDIAVPYTGLPTATMDTHSTGAYSFFPGGGKDPIVYRGMGLGRPTTDLPPAAYSSSATGSKGLYGAMVDAHDLARKELGLDRTNAVQSVTWEGVRDLWGEEAKTAALKRAIADIQRTASSPEEMRFSVAELLGRPVRRIYQVK